MFGALTWVNIGTRGRRSGQRKTPRGGLVTTPRGATHRMRAPGRGRVVPARPERQAVLSWRGAVVPVRRRAFPSLMYGSPSAARVRRKVAASPRRVTPMRRKVPGICCLRGRAAPGGDAPNGQPPELARPSSLPTERNARPVPVAVQLPASTSRPVVPWPSVGRPAARRRWPAKSWATRSGRPGCRR